MATGRVRREEVEHMRDLLDAGLSPPRIAEVIGRDANTVRRYLQGRSRVGNASGPPEWVEDANTKCRNGTRGELQDERRKRLARLVYGDGVPLEEARAIVARAGL